MGQSDEKDPVMEQVERILDDLMDEVFGAAGGDRESAVENWWRNQYRAKFYYAIFKKGKLYDTDKPKLMEKGRELGEFARVLAHLGPITTLHAALASHKVDCRAGVGAMEDWCN